MAPAAQQPPDSRGCMFSRRILAFMGVDLRRYFYRTTRSRYRKVKCSVGCPRANSRAFDLLLTAAPLSTLEESGAMSPYETLQVLRPQVGIRGGAVVLWRKSKVTMPDDCLARRQDWTPSIRCALSAPRSGVASTARERAVRAEEQPARRVQCRTAQRARERCRYVSWSPRGARSSVVSWCGRGMQR